MTTIRFPPDAVKARALVHIDERPSDMRTSNNSCALFFAELSAIEVDLESAVECLEYVYQNSGKADLQHLRNACWDSALIRYRRCFASGVRKSLDIEKFLGNDEQKNALHSHLMNLANKNIAHSVSSQEQCIPFLALLDDGDGLYCAAHGHQYIAARADHAENVKKIHFFVNAVLEFLRVELSAASEIFDRYVASLDSVELSGLPEFSLTVNPNEIEVGKRRKASA